MDTKLFVILVLLLQSLIVNSELRESVIVRLTFLVAPPQLGVVGAAVGAH